jgi:galactose-1-phosphate uridylyltransferase
MSDKSKACLFCERDQNQIPLVNLNYQGEKLYICPQHLPILIHDPTQLAGKLDGAEKMRPADHHD